MSSEVGAWVLHDTNLDQAIATLSFTYIAAAPWQVLSQTIQNIFWVIFIGAAEGDQASDNFKIWHAGTVAFFCRPST